MDTLDCQKSSYHSLSLDTVVASTATCSLISDQTSEPHYPDREFIVHFCSKTCRTTEEKLSWPVYFLSLKGTTNYPKGGGKPTIDITYFNKYRWRVESHVFFTRTFAVSFHDAQSNDCAVLTFPDAKYCDLSGVSYLIAPPY